MKLTRKNLKLPFDALTQMGYFAQQKWKCCQSCGCAAVSKEKKYYVFYHEQDAEGMAKKGYTYLTWTGNGHEICEVFKASGFDTEWDGDIEKRIKILTKSKNPITVGALVEKVKKNIYVG